MMPLYVYTHSQNITSPFYDNRYCRDACFKRCWDDHTRLHQQQAKADLEQQQAEKQFGIILWYSRDETNLWSLLTLWNDSFLKVT